MDTWQRIKKIGGLGLLTRQDIDEFHTQRLRILWLMLDHRWHSAEEIRQAGKGSEALRRLRELREIPGASIERRRKKSSREWEYRLVQHHRDYQQQLFS